MKYPDYVELRMRSAFSFLEGAAAPEELVERAAALGYPAVALGDRDGLYGAVRFYRAAKRAGLKPLVGAELSLAAQECGASGAGAAASPARLYLLAPDRPGYRKLCRMITAAKLRAAKGADRITLEDLDRFGRGLLCLGGGAASPLARLMRRGADPRPLCRRLKSIFGAGNFFIDLQRHLDPGEERLNRRLMELAEACRVPLAASNDVCQSGPERALLDVLSCIRLKTTLEAAGRALWANNERHLKPPAEMAALFRDLPQALAHTREIAERCAFTLENLGYRFPAYPLAPGRTAEAYLRELSWAGARRRWGGRLDGPTRLRLEHELGVIERLGLAGYFLIVWDIVRFCREQGIMVQGRGSAANSAVCYALGITAVDAIRMDLLFERFLSEERGQWPDIDLDLPAGAERERVIQYVYRRYGARGAAMTANVITFRRRSALREVAKVLGFAPAEVERMARLNHAYEFRDRHDELARLLQNGGVNPAEPRVAMLLELVRQTQHLPRHLGQHSGGMVIAAGALDEIVPLEPATMPGRVVIQWDKEDCADLGIIKIDLLGLGMLAVLEQAIPLVGEHEGVELDLAQLPHDDPGVYAMLRRADTIGVFQVESRAQMATLVRMKPRHFYDLVVEVAIIRPGPIVGGMVHPYLARRNGIESVRYDHPALEPILRRTLGVPLFQEQLLRMATAVAGFSPGEAEELRRAMGFRHSSARMEMVERRLRDGMACKGISGAVAERIIRSITSFALYGFPESHAASFALIAYASAYLKHHHPVEFFTAMLNCYPLGFYHPSTLVQDARRHAVTVLPIDVTCSAWDCTVEHLPPGPAEAPSKHPGAGTKGGALPRRRLALRLGLKYVRGLSAALGCRIERERARRLFASLADFAARTEPSRRELDALALSGALAALTPGRRRALWQAAVAERDPQSLLAHPQAACGQAAAPAADVASNGNDTLAAADDDCPLDELTPLEETLVDYDATGLTAGPHLLAHLRPWLKRHAVLSAAELARAADDATVKTAGAVIVRQRPGTAKGFFFATLEDETGISNVVVTPDCFQRWRTLLSSAPLLLVEGMLQRRSQGAPTVRGLSFAELRTPS
jgi:error-prone DNA polymerase